MSTTMSVTATDGGGISNVLTLDEDDVAWQQNSDDDLNASLAQGCLKLGDDKLGEDNNNVELRPRQRYAPTWLCDTCIVTLRYTCEVSYSVAAVNSGVTRGADRPG